MFEALANMKVNDNSPELKKILKELSELDILVGVPEENSSREDEPVTNAELVFIHTHGVRSKPMREEMKDNITNLGYSAAYSMYIQAHGSPLMSVPPRPIIEAAIEHPPNTKIIGEELGKVLEKVINEDYPGALQQCEKAGIVAETLVKDWWDNPANGWPENSPATIAAKGSDKPLVDTGELRKAITSTVVKK